MWFTFYYGLLAKITNPGEHSKPRAQRIVNFEGLWAARKQKKIEIFQNIRHTQTR